MISTQLSVVIHLFRGCRQMLDAFSAHLRYKMLVKRGYDLGKDVYLGAGTSLGGKIRIGDQTTIVGSTLIQGNVQIGSNVIVAAIV